MRNTMKLKEVPCLCTLKGNLKREARYAITCCEMFCLFYFIIFFEIGSTCSPTWPETCYVGPAFLYLLSTEIKDVNLHPHLEMYF